MRCTLPYLLACLSLVTAAPSTFDPELIDDVFARDLIGEIDADALLKRTDIKSYRDKIPGCDKDPSWVKEKDKGTKYKVDEGIKIPKSGKNDACTTGHNNDHCWTEYWIVESQIEFDDWKVTNVAMDCATAKTCVSGDIALGQTCTSIGASSTVGVSGQFQAGFETAEAANTTNGFHIGSPKGSYSWSKTNEHEFEMCTTKGAYGFCGWSDKGCHQVWTSQRNRRLFGYSARVCTGKTSKPVQQQTKNKKGHWVRGQLGFNMLMPIGKLVGCKAKCDQQKYPDKKPRTQGPARFWVDGW
ncbi:hypothetical protein F4779DRAFT_623521 [Xylariaceae sp. FL0662B]|nr:hypothetical protein F4779DRAFT_623521 [Xylariaceae sp. FL0662B]